jgi:alcohol dehydrogenase, propanol-preferring
MNASYGFQETGPGIAWVRDTCQTCEHCLSPDGETRCAEQLNSGRKWDGTFAEYAVIPSRYIIQILDSIKLADAVIAPVLCGGVTAYKALKISGETPEQWIEISGVGGGRRLPRNSVCVCHGIPCDSD